MAWNHFKRKKMERIYYPEKKRSLQLKGSIKNEATTSEVLKFLILFMISIEKMQSLISIPKI